MSKNGCGCPQCNAFYVEAPALRAELAAKDAEINRLTYELDKSRDSHMRRIAELEHAAGRHRDLAADRLAELQRQAALLDRAEAALKFYASGRLEASDPHCSVWEGWSYASGDKRPTEQGTRAREALAAINAAKAGEKEGERNGKEEG